MTKELLLSIILPVYNGEKFLDGCIKSLCNQGLGFDEYEIIVVDDGSTDSSLVFTRKLMVLYPNIVLVQQNNHGVAFSRNKGMENARGKWLTFIDHDDLFKLCSLGTIRELLINSNDEIIKFAIEDLDSMNYKSIMTFYPEHELNCSENGIKFYHWYRNCGIYTGIDSSWSIFYNMDFINKNKLRFLEGIIYLEDAEFLGRVFCLAQRCSFYNFPYYLHNNNPNSVSNSKIIFSQRAINGFIACAQNIRDFRNGHILNHNQKIFLNNLINKFAFLVLQQPVTNKEFKPKRYLELIDRLRENNLNKLSLEGCSNDIKFWARIFNISKVLFILSWLGYLIKTSLRSKIRNRI